MHHALLPSLCASALLGALLLTTSSCSQEEGAGGSAGRSSRNSAPVPPIANPAPPADRAQWGSIEGVVHFVGEPPRQREISGLDNVSGCGVHEETPTREEVTVRDGKLRDVLVRLRTRDLHADALGAAPSEPAVLAQEGCIYRPHVLGLAVGQTLHVTNEDGAEHNVHAKPRRAQEVSDARLNRGQRPGAEPLEFGFEISGEFEAIPFKCDLHPWMNAWVCVVEHSYFAISDAEGRFVLPEVPPGEYWLESWHETLGEDRVRIVVPESSAAQAEFSYRP